MKTKLGRPPIPEDERKTEMISIPLSPTQFALLGRAAEKRGRPVAAWARDVLLKAAQR